jgi:hypothetical protein
MIVQQPKRSHQQSAEAVADMEGQNKKVDALLNARFWQT